MRAGRVIACRTGCYFGRVYFRSLCRKRRVTWCNSPALESHPILPAPDCAALRERSERWKYQVRTSSVPHPIGGSRELASRRLDAEQKKFELGTSTVRFVLEEQRNLAQAESDEIQALVNYTKSLVVYDKAIGNTLVRNNTQFDKQLPGQLASQK